MPEEIVQSPNSVMANHVNDIVALESIQEAGQRINKYIHCTPVLTCSYLNGLAKKNLFFKCENLQKTGSFKIRGALNSIARIQNERGSNNFTVVTHSSGNHAQGIALASKLMQIEGKVVMPLNAPDAKLNAVIGYGAKVYKCESTAQGRHSKCSEVMKENLESSEYIPPGDHPFIMEGQGTIGLEMIANNPDLDAIVVACSCGGLLSGVAVACKSLKPDIKVFGCEPKEADDLAQSFDLGKRTELESYPNTIADALRMSVGLHTWPVIKQNVDTVITVTEDEIISAMYLMWERLKLVVEPSGAVALAAVLTDQFKLAAEGLQNIGILVCGGNTDLKNIPWMRLENKD